MKTKSLLQPTRKSYAPRPKSTEFCGELRIPHQVKNVRLIAKLQERQENQNQGEIDYDEFKPEVMDMLLENESQDMALQNVIE